MVIMFLGIHCSAVAAFPDLSTYLGENDAIFHPPVAVLLHNIRILDISHISVFYDTHVRLLCMILVL